jgi:outer membrane murein-binding lipoprotein Lpp
MFTFKKAAFLLPALLAVQLLIGCAPAISQEQYNSMQSELKSTKDQLAAAQAQLASLKSQPVPAAKDQFETPRKTLADLKPYLDLDLLILDEELTLNQQNTKEITVSYANVQYAEQRNRLNDLLKQFDDKEFANTVNLAWSDSDDAKARLEAWALTYSTVRNRLKNDFDALSKQMNP